VWGKGGRGIMSLTLGNIQDDKGNCLCEVCQEPVNYNTDLYYDGFELYHTKCWEGRK